MEGTNNEETFLYGDTDIHHVSSEEKMILYNDCDETYHTIVPSFLFDNSLRKEAEDDEDGTRCCAVIPEELKSIGDFFIKRDLSKKDTSMFTNLFYIYFVMRFVWRKHIAKTTLLFLSCVGQLFSGGTYIAISV